MALIYLWSRNSTVNLINLKKGTMTKQKKGHTRTKMIAEMIKKNIRSCRFQEKTEWSEADTNKIKHVFFHEKPNCW